MPPPTDPRAMSEYPDPLSFSLLNRLRQQTDRNGYPHPDIADTQSLISRLTAKPVVNEARLPATTHSTSKPDDTLIYPDPTPDPDIKPKVECLKPQFHRKVEHIPAVGGEATLEGSEDAAEDEERENQIPKNNNDPLMPSLRNPTLAPTLMMQLVDCVSALCADWSAISPNIAHSTCAVDASKLSLNICLVTALTNEGLATLCRMVAIMTMNKTTMTNHTTILAENVDMLITEYDRNAQLLFVGEDPKKVRMLSVEEQQAMGWQPIFDVPSTPWLGVVEEMPDLDERPDTSYDYDTELYGDGES
uniref:Reverse transcriptase-rnase h-integrase n=1 Tax=Moniliophthora roreri TaxID=221103 RepID=A0A0W0G877_MONRR